MGYDGGSVGLCRELDIQKAMSQRIADFLAKCAADVYAEPRDGGHDYITAEMCAVVARRLAVGAHILDVGCGQGPALEWFCSHGFNPCGITMSEEDKRTCGTKGFGVWIEDQNELGEWLIDFDCVWARHVIEHSPIPYFTLTEFNRVLKPGGILYVEVPMPGTSCKHETNVNHYSVLTREMWASLIIRAGFVIEETHNINIGTPVGPDQYFSVIAIKPL